jgi:hypothetical protein
MKPKRETAGMYAHIISQERDHLEFRLEVTLN